MLKARWILALTAAVAVAVSVAEARPPTGKCRSARGNVIAVNKLVVAYELGRPDATAGNDAISGRLIGCLRASGNKVQLSGSTFGEYWFDAPARAVKVRGTTIGFAALRRPGVRVELRHADLLRRHAPPGIDGRGERVRPHRQPRLRSLLCAVRASMRAAAPHGSVAPSSTSG